MDKMTALDRARIISVSVYDKGKSRLTLVGSDQHRSVQWPGGRSNFGERAVHSILDKFVDRVVMQSELCLSASTTITVAGERGGHELPMRFGRQERGRGSPDPYKCNGFM
jgi:hypothetical protein